MKDKAPRPVRVPFLRNADLLAAIARAQALGRVTDELGKMLLLLANKFFQKPNYRGYSYRDELEQDAVAMLVFAALKFNPEKSSNPFAYYTSVMINSANRVFRKELKQRSIRDDMLMEEGHAPSHTAQLDHEIASGFLQIGNTAPLPSHLLRNRSLGRPRKATLTEP